MTLQPFPSSESQTPRTLLLELFALDLTSCTRCVGTLGNIEAAIDLVQQVLRATGITIGVRKVVVGSEEEARRHRLVSSPTIRIDGRDIVFETMESQCDSCTDLCGCAEGTACRVWRYQGAEHTEAPVGLIVEALLREIAGSPLVPPAGASGHEVPPNLRSFFAGKTSRAGEAEASCCAPSEQSTCCEPAEKASCCSQPEPASCGCR